MMFVIGIVLFALAILISVALHECGHMWVALGTGMKVRRYFVGFGPTLWSTRRGETGQGVEGADGQARGSGQERKRQHGVCKDPGGACRS